MNYRPEISPASYPPLEAYRRDLARLGHGRTFGANDGAWVATAMLLQQYVDGTSGDRTVVAAELARFLAPQQSLTFADAALRFGAHIERAGALNLAATWLSLLDQSLVERTALDAGRIRAQRASVIRKLGGLDAARDLYAEIEILGESASEPELLARAWIGYAILAHMRGNYPEMRRWYARAAGVADDNGLVEQTFATHQGLMIVAGVARDFDGAVQEGWKAFLACDGERDREAEVLTNMAQLLHEAGHHMAALRGFAAAIPRTTLANVLLPALGGAALAAACSGRRDVVEAAARHVELIEGSSWEYPMSSVCLDLADAHSMLGLESQAEPFRERGLTIARKNGFHELVHRLESRVPLTRGTSEPSMLSDGATRVVAGIVSLGAAELAGIGRYKTL